MKRHYKIGIIGTGRAARTHAEVLKKRNGIEVAALTGRDYKKARALTRELGISWCPPSIQELTASPDIDAVVIAVPPFLQPDIAIAAFRQGKHVLCEKPLAVDRRNLYKMRKAWKDSRMVGMVNFCYKLLPAFREFKKRIMAGDCGQLNLIQAQWILSNRLDKNLTYNWKCNVSKGGGVLQNFGIHLIDYLFCDMPKTVLLGAKQNILFKTRRDERGNIRRCTGDEVITAFFSTKEVTPVFFHCSLVTMTPRGCFIIAEGNKGTLEIRSQDLRNPAGPYSLWWYKDSLESGRCLLAEPPLAEPGLFSLFARTAERFADALKNNATDEDLSLDNGVKASEYVFSIQKILGY